MARRVIAGTVLVLLGCYLFGHTMPRAWRSLNTDFPNYYLAARLTREGVDPSRAYEWIWLQREKDHRNIDQRVVGLVPITPFSTLAMWPLTGLPPLAAKHAWLTLQSRSSCSHCVVDERRQRSIPAASRVSPRAFLPLASEPSLRPVLHRSAWHSDRCVLGNATATKSPGWISDCPGRSGQDFSRHPDAALCAEKELASTPGVLLDRRSLSPGFCLGLWLESSPHVFTSSPTLDAAG